MKVIFFGTPQFAVPSLERLLEHPDFEVVGVVTQPDKRRGRGNQLIPSPVKVVAETYQLPIWQAQRIKKHQETLTKLRDSQADAFVVVAYGQILSQTILDLPRLGCVNGHGSILPKYRGAAPIQWCLYHGEPSTGMTTMLMDAGMDTGAMLLKEVTPIGLFDTAVSLGERLATISANLLIETLLQLEQGKIKPTPQDNAVATYAPLIQDQDFILDWNKSAIALHNQIRGFYPNCLTGFRNQSLKVYKTVPLGLEYVFEFPPELESLKQHCSDLPENSGQPGEIVKLIKRFGPVVQTGSGLLLLREVQLAGKRVQSAWDFANGTRLAVGEILS